MEMSKLTDYDKFILMTQGKRMGSTMAAFFEFRTILQLLEVCAKSDAQTISWKEKIIDKPINRSEASSLLDSFNRAKWNNKFVTLAHQMGVVLR